MTEMQGDSSLCDIFWETDTMWLTRMVWENNRESGLHCAEFHHLWAILFSLMQTTLRRHATYGFWLRKDWRVAKKEDPKWKMSMIMWPKRERKESLYHFHSISDTDNDKIIQMKKDNGMTCSAARLINVNVRIMRENIGENTCLSSLFSCVSFYEILQLFKSFHMHEYKWVTFTCTNQDVYLSKKMSWQENSTISTYFGIHPGFASFFLSLSLSHSGCFNKITIHLNKNIRTAHFYVASDWRWIYKK